MPQQSKAKLQFDGRCWYCGEPMADLGDYYACKTCGATHCEIPETILPVFLTDEYDKLSKKMIHRPRSVRQEEERVKRAR